MRQQVAVHGSCICFEIAFVVMCCLFQSPRACCTRLYADWLCVTSQQYSSAHCARTPPKAPSPWLGGTSTDDQGARQVAFIEELQRRLTPVNGKAVPLPTSKSSPSLAHHDGVRGLPPGAMDEMRGEHKSPFELRALEVALDVVSHWPSIITAPATQPQQPMLRMTHARRQHLLSAYRRGEVGTDSEGVRRCQKPLLCDG